MRKPFKIILVYVVLTIVGSFVALSTAEAAEPWKGQIVDAETGKPLEGVVVLAVWFKYLRFLGLHGYLGYGASQETVTDQEGRFTIGSRSSWTLNPFVRLDGPEFLIFKSGYGQWRFRGADEWMKLDAYERNKRNDEAWEQFEGEGVVIELPPLKTWQARRKFLSYALPTGEIPYSEIPTYLAAINRERASLGFSPLGR